MAKTAIYGKTASPGGLFAIEDQGLTTGNRWFVDSGAAHGGNSASKSRSPEAPFLTLSYAFSGDQPTSNNGDVIYVMPGHVENVISAAAIACDIEGVRVVGLGEGSDKPTFTFTTATTATITMTAASVTLENLRFVGDIDALAVGIAVSAPYCSIINCEFIDNGTDNVIDWITLSAAADNFLCKDCINTGTATAGNDSFISIGAASNVRIINLLSQGDFAAANIECTAAPVDLLVENCKLENANAVDVCIEGFAAATGWLVKNMCRIATDAQTTWINTPGAMSLFENYGVNNDGETGLIIGTASA